jgi:hypothetical protein
MMPLFGTLLRYEECAVAGATAATAKRSPTVRCDRCRMVQVLVMLLLMTVT